MKRLVYTGTLRFPHGFHTGDGRRLGASDQPLFREPDGSVALAGTSLAGVLRADLRRLLAATGGTCVEKPECQCVVCRLMGPIAPRGRRGASQDVALRASRLHVVGGRAEAEGGVRVRDRVGIDRRTRTAADRRKYDLELLDGPVRAPFTLRIDKPEDDERRYLEAVLRRLAHGWLFLGGKIGSGPGRAELAQLERSEIDLGVPETLIAHLLADDPAAGGTAEVLVGDGDGDGWAEEWELDMDPTANGAPDTAQIRLHVEIDFPWGYLVHDPAEALSRGFDHAYLRREDGAPVLPGSSLRGALRSRAEQMLRTLAGAAAACDLHTKDRACHERIEAESRGEGKLTLADELALLCPACLVFGSGRLVSSVKVTDFLPLAGHEGQSRRQEQVAIDRFTGGAAAGAKFDSESQDGVTFAGEVHLEIGPHRLGSWGLGLLALVLRDLLWEDVPLGFGTARGFNEHRVRLIGVDRFWIAPPEALAGGGLGLDPGAGTRRYRPPAEAPIDSPDAAGVVAGPELAARLAAWVEALHARLAAVEEVAP